MTEVITKPGRCYPFELAIWLTRILPRGKGVAPRFIGRVARRWINHSMETRHGALLPILPDALDMFVWMAGQQSSCDYWVFRAIERVLKPGAVVYDIGANVGYIAVELAHKHRDQGVHVYAFEPNGAICQGIAIAKDINHLPNLDVFDIAVGSERAEIAFSVMPHSVHSSAVPRTTGATRVVRVQQDSIDRLVEAEGLRPPDIIKIDVEGYELEVLRGARNTVAKFKPHVIFEVSDNTSQMVGSLNEFFEFFEAIGGYQICSLRGAPIDMAKETFIEGVNRDYMAVPQ